MPGAGTERTFEMTQRYHTYPSKYGLVVVFLFVVDLISSAARDHSCLFLLEKLIRFCVHTLAITSHDNC